MNLGDKTLIVITGPTASGKSALALDMAERLGTEIISADSRQIYKGIPIATAAPTAEEMARVRHHLVGCLPLESYYSASMFEEDAIRIAHQIFKEHDYAIVCGGSMMYVDALCYGLDELPTVPDEIRASLMQKWEENGDEWLLAELMRLDSEYYGRVDRCNLKRVFHAVEISIVAGAPYSSLLGKRELPKRGFKIKKFGIARPREELFERINRRAEIMLEQGLVQEARRVYPLRHLNSLNTVGLKEMFAYIGGVWDLPTALARLQKNTRVYAKKQLTWLARQTDITWLTAEQAKQGIEV